MVIYKTTNLINGKIYIGQDSKNNPNYYGSGVYLLKAIKKYEKNNFKKEILEHCSSMEELNKKEKYYIEKYKSRSRNIGYNVAKGGLSSNGWYECMNESAKKEYKLKHSLACSKFNQTKEYKDKQSIRSKEMWSRKEFRDGFIPKWKKVMDKYYTKEKRIEISKSVKKRYKNPEYKKKWLESMKKVNQDPIIRKKRSERIKGKNNPGWKGYVYMIDDEGNDIAIFEDRKTMLELLPLPKETICDCLVSGDPYKANICTRDNNETKKIKKQYKGYRFEYRKT